MKEYIFWLSVRLALWCLRRWAFINYKIEREYDWFRINNVKLNWYADGNKYQTLEEAQNALFEVRHNAMIRKIQSFRADYARKQEDKILKML